MKESGQQGVLIATGSSIWGGGREGGREGKNIDSIHITYRERGHAIFSMVKLSVYC